ncbi:MAG TPA: PAS domain S-box protein [Coleofasciculaceae cyanobacterium]
METFDQLKLRTDVPVVITDRQGFILEINPYFTSIFGWNSSEIQGKIITVIIPNGFHDAHHLGFSRFLSTEQSTILNHPLQLKAITKNGREIAAEHLIMAEQHQGEWRFAALLRPLESI